MQFGFKPNRLTAMCSMIMTEIISYYVKINSNVHCVFLDATKSFDRVEYGKLFKLLLPSHDIRVLLNMYIKDSW
jgi:hypothetical protein